MWVVEIDVLIVCWPRTTCFRRSMKINFVWVVEVDLLFVCSPKITRFQDKHESWLRFCVGGLNWLDFSAGDRVWFDIRVGIKLIWLLCGSSKFTWFLKAGRKSFVFSVSTQIDSHLCGWFKRTSFHCGGSNLTWFRCSWTVFGCCVGRRKWLHFIVEDRQDLLLCNGRKRFVFIVRIEISWVICVGASKSTWYWIGDQNWLDFNGGVEINLVLPAG